jgi:hypothetical protein
MDQEGKEMGYPTFPNTLPGAKALESQLLQILKEKGFSTLRIFYPQDRHRSDLFSRSPSGRLPGLQSGLGSL